MTSLWRDRWPRLVALAVLLSASAAQADEITVMAANALREPLQLLVPAFEASSGHHVTIVWGGTDGIANRVAAGEATDVVIIGSTSIERLVRDGKLLGLSRPAFASSGVGVAVRAGAPRPDISSVDAVRQTIVAARSIAYSSGPSGLAMAELFLKLGVDAQVKGKLVQPSSGTPVAELLSRGEAELAFQQVSELLHAKGITYVGPLPADIQSITVYAMALGARARSPSAARALATFLSAPATAPVLRAAGLEPG